MITFDHISHQYFIDHTPVKSVTQILDAAGLTDFSRVPADVLQRAMDFGTAVHTTITLYEKNDLDVDMLDEALVPYLKQWMDFRNTYQWHTLDTEQIVASRRYLYCGTYDIKGTWGGHEKLTILDIKTGSKTKATTMAAGIQLAGYEIAHNEEARGKNKVTQRMSLWLNGGLGIPPGESHDNKLDHTKFLHAITVANTREEMGIWKKSSR